MSSWGWRIRGRTSPKDALPGSVRAVSAAVPWITVLLLLFMLSLIARKITLSGGVLFELPGGSVEAEDFSETTEVALLFPSGQGTFVFYNDQRYILEDESQASIFAEHLAERLRGVESPVLHVLADTRIRHGTLMKFAAMARACGVERLLFAEKKESGGLE